MSETDESGEFFEDDEPVEDILSAFEAGVRLLTCDPGTYGAPVTVEVTSPFPTVQQP